MIGILPGCGKLCLSSFEALAGGGDFAWGGGAGRDQAGERIEIVLGLIESETVLLDFGCGSLAFGLGSIVLGGFEGGLRGFDGALSAGDLRAGLHIVERDEELACRNQIAFVGVDSFHRGGERTIELVVRDGFYSAVGADRVLNGGVSHVRQANRQSLAEKITRREKNGYEDDSDTNPRPSAACLRSYFSHAL